MSEPLDSSLTGSLVLEEKSEVYKLVYILTSLQTFKRLITQLSKRQHDRPLIQLINKYRKYTLQTFMEDFDGQLTKTSSLNLSYQNLVVNLKKSLLKVYQSFQTEKLEERYCLVVDSNNQVLFSNQFTNTNTSQGPMGPYSKTLLLPLIDTESNTGSSKLESLVGNPLQLKYIHSTAQQNLTTVSTWDSSLYSSFLPQYDSTKSDLIPSTSTQILVQRGKEPFDKDLLTAEGIDYHSLLNQPNTNTNANTNHVSSCMPSSIPSNREGLEVNALLDLNRILLGQLEQFQSLRAKLQLQLPTQIELETANTFQTNCKLLTQQLQPNHLITKELIHNLKRKLVYFDAEFLGNLPDNGYKPYAKK